MVFIWRGIINKISERTNLQILRRARKAMRVTAAVVKVSLTNSTPDQGVYIHFDVLI